MWCIIVVNSTEYPSEYPIFFDQYHKNHNTYMSNTNVDDNSHHEEIVTESTSGLSDENHLNATTDAEASNSVSTNSNGTTIDSQNEENQVTKRAPDWSFLNGAGKKRKHNFKVRLVSK